MKTNRTQIRLFVVIFMAMLFHGCQKDFDLLDRPSAEVQGEAGVLDKAKEWYRQNMQHAKGTHDLDVRLLMPDWDNSVLSENAAGQPWISIPLKNRAHPDVFLTQISLIIDKKGRANGIIKEYKKNPHIEDTELTIYTGSGKLYEKGTYKHKRRSLFVKHKGTYLTGKHKLYRIAYGQKLAMERTSLNFFKVAGGSGGNDGGEIAWELEIEEVIVPPPGGPGGDPWEDPFEDWWDWEDWGAGDWDGGGGDDGNGETEPNGGGGCNCAGGGNPAGPSKPSNQQVKDYIEDKPFALLSEDIPCETIMKWLAVAKHQVQQSQLDKLGSMVGYSWLGNMITEENIAWILDIDDAYSTVVNMDYFPITINQLPIINGQQLTAPQFLEYIRKNINDFVNTDLSEFTPYNANGINDNNLWNSNNPLNAIIGIQIGSYMGVSDNGSVIVSKYSNTGWTFTTIHDPLYGDHPVSGNRDFGYVENADGSYTFYTRGVDRLTNIDGDLLQRLNGHPFNSADQLWRSFQINIVNYVRQHGGTALWETLSTTEEIHRPDWQLVADVIDGKEPLSTLSKDCDD